LWQRAISHRRQDAHQSAAPTRATGAHSDRHDDPEVIISTHHVDDSSPWQAAEGAGATIPAMYHAADSAAGTAPGFHGAVVAAVDDDANPPSVLAYAAAEARRRRVALRVVHVWTESGPPAAGLPMCRHDGMADADRLLSTVLYDHLPADEAAAERQILNDEDPVAALLALTAHASLLVVGANSSWPPTRPAALGETVRALVGRTGCPLAVLPASAP
jgi:hypothetical protein